MYRVEIIHTHDYTFRAKTKNAEFIIDAKAVSGVTPPDALLASLGSCIGTYLRKYAEGSNLKLDDFTVTVQAEFVKDAAVSFKMIKATVDLKNASLDERRKKACLEFIKNCPIHNTLKGNPQVEIELS